MRYRERSAAIFFLFCVITIPFLNTCASSRSPSSILMCHREQREAIFLLVLHHCERSAAILLLVLI